MDGISGLADRRGDRPRDPAVDSGRAMIRKRTCFPEVILLFDQGTTILSSRPPARTLSRAAWVKAGGTAAAPQARLGLDASEHGGTLSPCRTSHR